MGSVVVVLDVLVVEVVVVVVVVEVLGSCSLLNMEVQQMVCSYFIWIKQ